MGYVAQAEPATVHAEDVIESLENDIFPAIGDLPIRLILAPKPLEVLNKVEERGAIETAHRLRQRVSSIFVYGIAAGLCEADPAASLGKVLKKKLRATKQPSIIDGIEDQDERIAAVRGAGQLRQRALPSTDEVRLAVPSIDRGPTERGPRRSLG